jgi:hypothetical protein
VLIAGWLGMDNGEELLMDGNVGMFGISVCPSSLSLHVFVFKHSFLGVFRYFSFSQWFLSCASGSAFATVGC